MASRKYISKSSIPLLDDVNIGLVVDDVLDISILENKFAQLIEGSPVLGGTMRCTPDSRKFRCGSTVDFEARTLDHDLNTFLPFSWQGSTEPTILHQQFPAMDGNFMFKERGEPKPLCLLRATVLKDATLLCFSFVHGLFDGQSGFDMIRYFCDLLSNKPIPKFILPPDANGARMSDLIRVPGGEQGPHEPPRVFVTKPLKMLKIQGKFLLEKLRELFGLSEKLMPKLFHLPGSWVDKVRARAQMELDSSPENIITEKSSAVQLTRNDIIAAVYLKVLYGSKRPSDGPVDLVGPINYRGLLEPQAPGTYYNHNSIIFLRCQLSEREIQTGSVAKVAEKIRLATTQYKHPAIVKREVRFIEDKVPAPSLVDFRGGFKWGFVFVTPWTTFNHKGLDFSGASRNGGRTPSVVYVNPEIRLLAGTLPSPSLVTLKDGSGGYWLRGANTASGWKAFEDCVSLEKLFTN